MPEKLKDILIPADQVIKLAETINCIWPEFDVQKFTGVVIDCNWCGVVI